MARASFVAYNNWVRLFWYFMAREAAFASETPTQHIQHSPEFPAIRLVWLPVNLGYLICS
jgi:hypothetical protein